MSDQHADTGATRWRKKPVVIEAIRYRPGRGGNCEAVAEFIGDRDALYEHERWGCSPNSVWLIHTLFGIMQASPGDWIIREPSPTADRRYYPCKPDIFAATYEAVVVDDREPSSIIGHQNWCGLARSVASSCTCRPQSGSTKEGVCICGFPESDHRGFGSPAYDTACLGTYTPMDDYGNPISPQSGSGGDRG